MKTILFTQDSVIIKKNTINKAIKFLVLFVFVSASLFYYNYGGVISDFRSFRIDFWISGLIVSAIITLGIPLLIFFFIKPSIKKFLLFAGITDLLLCAWQYWMFIGFISSDYTNTDLMITAVVYFGFFVVVFGFCTFAYILYNKAKKKADKA